MGKYYLKRIHMQAFGRFADVTVGPFAPGLNAVYGKNEAGKTTVNAFVRGVLFGWEDARGSKNVYKPASAERSGSLIFVQRASEAAARDKGGKPEKAKAKREVTVELSRVRNVDGLVAKPEDALSLVDDIDKRTYNTVFALTSDELRGLGDAGDMMSHLLTAGSGATISPAQALSSIDDRIATYTSRAASATHSFPNLKKRLDDCRARLADARSESDEFKEEARERESLSSQREATARDLAEANARGEQLAALKADLERLSAQQEEALRLRDESQREMDACDAAARAAIDAGAMRISAADEAALRESIAVAQSSCDRIAHRMEAAQDDFSDARARYEAAKAAAGARPQKRGLAWVVAVAALAVAGMAWGVAGTRVDNLALCAVGVVCMAAAIALAIAMVVSMRPRRRGEDEVDVAYREMLERKSVLESREAESLEARMKAEGLLKSAGMADAGGSLRRAVEMLDAARNARQARESAVARLQEATARRDSFAKTVEECGARMRECLESCGFDGDAISADVESQVLEAAQRRKSLTDRLEAQNRRIGELDQILAAAERDCDLDVLKTERAQIVTRQNESGMELARLLLARRMMAQAISAWEGESQPEVYARASELMSLMTDGAWTGVRAHENGLILAVDAVGRAWEPRLLSLGTCQQLYLALRIALLECVEQVGSNLPVLADDILVNFDDERRRGAVKALVQLSKKRQVIIFTCHKEVVDLIASHAKECKVLGL